MGVDTKSRAPLSASVVTSHLFSAMTELTISCITASASARQYGCPRKATDLHSRPS